MIVKNEHQAWKLLERYLDGGAVERTVFENWPRMEISISGDEYHSTISAGQMAAYLEFQATINRAYASIARGHFDARYLTNSEEEELTLRTEVKEGSSILETDLSPLVQALSSVVGRSSPVEIIVGGVLISLALTSPLLVKMFFEGRARELELKNSGALISALASKTQEEQMRLKTFNKALKSVSKVFPAIVGLMPQLKNSQLALLGSMSDAESATINGVRIDEHQILDLNNRLPRASSTGSTLVATLEILSMQRSEKFYRLKLENKHQAVIAKLFIAEFTENKIGRLLNAFRKQIGVEFSLKITRDDQATLKGVVQDFVVPQGT